MKLKDYGFFFSNLRFNFLESMIAHKMSYVKAVLKIYAAPVWNPSIHTDVNRIEQVPKNAARFVINNSSPYSNTSELVKNLNWNALEQRRLASQVTLLYKLHNNLINLPFSDIVKRFDRSFRYNSCSYGEP